MSTKPNQELIDHITKLLNSDTDCARTRWAIALAHHNRLTVEDATIEELDDLMSPDAETVGEWLEYLAEGEDTSVFTDNPQLFHPEADEKAAEEAADQPFYDDRLRVPHPLWVGVNQTHETNRDINNPTM